MRFDTIINAQNISAGYGRSSSLWRDVNFSIGRGEFVAVLGPNGAGKTTLFQLLLGMQKPRSGTITVLGESPRRGNPRIGYVPQRHDIDRETTTEAIELVRLGLSGTRWGISLHPRRERRAAHEALVAVDAAHLAHRPLGELSGGELQRVFLAEALASNPDVLLLDEPLANLDLRRERELVTLVAHVVRTRKVTVVLIAHDINPLLPALDRVVYVAHGRVMAGTPDEVLTSEVLTDLYQTPVEVLRDTHGRVAVLGIESGHTHHE